MTEDELNEAVEALVRWLQSQSLSVEDSVPVCAKVICVAVLFIAERNNADPQKGARAAARMIEDAIKSAGRRAETAPRPRRRPF